jgi:hypothetical protein
MLDSMKKTIAFTALVTCLSTLLAVFCFAWAALPTEKKLENSRVRVSLTTYVPGVPRERYIRATDQVIVFLDNCKYERKDSKTGEKTIRERKSGDVIWHDKGEDAPQLTNLNQTPYRTLTIELK